MFAKLPRTKIPGLLGHTFDPKDVYEDELLSGVTDVDVEEVIKRPSYISPQQVKFINQGIWPFCTCMAVTGAVTDNLGLMDDPLSPTKLFFDIHGSLKGSNVRDALNMGTKGLMTLSECPMPEDIWDDSTFAAYRTKVNAIAHKESEAKIDGFAAVRLDSDSLRRAIVKYKEVIIGGYAHKGWFTPYTTRKGSPDDHVIRLKGWDMNGWIRQDSITDSAASDGTYTLSKDYNFYFAYVLTDVTPAARAEIYKKRKEGFERCLNHYGKPRDFEAEQAAAMLLVAEFTKFHNQSVWEAAGKFWTVYINAVAYGGYSISYFKGMGPLSQWFPGDVINDCYNWRRTGQHIFDFNLTREEWVKANS